MQGKTATQNMRIATMHALGCGDKTACFASLGSERNDDQADFPEGGAHLYENVHRQVVRVPKYLE